MRKGDVTAVAGETSSINEQKTKHRRSFPRVDLGDGAHSLICRRKIS